MRAGQVCVFVEILTACISANCRLLDWHMCVTVLVVELPHVLVVAGCHVQDGAAAGWGAVTATADYTDELTLCLQHPSV